MMQDFSVAKMWGLIAVSMVCLIAVTTCVAANERRAYDRTVSAPVAASIPSAGNRAHDALVRLPSASQIGALEAAVLSAGYRCNGQRTFFMGFGERNSALWSIQCSGGKAYVVTIEADSVGSSKVLDCEFLKLAKMSCFERL